jgi:hypothetical protein
MTFIRPVFSKTTSLLGRKAYDPKPQLSTFFL